MNRLPLTAALVLALIPAGGVHAASVFKTVHSFQGGSDGAYPNGSMMVFGLQGRFGAAYGTTSAGGSSDCPGGCGVVFSVIPDGSSGYSYKVIYRFRGAGAGDKPVQPSEPYPCGSGKLCGATRFGGAGGWGNIYRLTDPGDGGQWSYEELYAFTGGSDGYYPTGPLPGFGANGRLYGVTRFGGDNGQGTLFQLIGDGMGGFTFDTIHQFGATANDGKKPLAVNTPHDPRVKPTLAVTAEGGNHNRGAVIKFTNNDADVLASFNGPAGSPQPSRGLGEAVGTTEKGGTSGKGTIYDLNPDTLKITTLFSFNGKNGAAPQGSPAVTGVSVFGMTNRGGKYDNGTVFVYSTRDGSFETLHDFRGANFADGGRPPGGPGSVNSHLVFGSTSVGGAKCNGAGEPSCGTVFVIER